MPDCFSKRHTLTYSHKQCMRVLLPIVLTWFIVKWVLSSKLCIYFRGSFPDVFKGGEKSHSPWKKFRLVTGLLGEDYDWWDQLTSGMIGVVPRMVGEGAVKGPKTCLNGWGQEFPDEDQIWWFHVFESGRVWVALCQRILYEKNPTSPWSFVVFFSRH